MGFSEIASAERGAGVRKREGLESFDRSLSNHGSAQADRGGAGRWHAKRRGKQHSCAGAEFDRDLSKLSRPSRLHAPAPDVARAISEKLIFHFEFLFHKIRTARSD